MPEREPQVSDNQLRLMVAIRDSQSVQTTEFLGSVRGRNRTAIGSENARKALTRLEERGTPLVSGDGHGRDRAWELTSDGRQLVDARRPPTEAGSSIRPYVVLEELELTELLARLRALDVDSNGMTVYIAAATVEARNTEHAYRQVAKTTFAKQADSYELQVREDGDEYFTVPCVAIDGKRFQTKQIDVDLGASVTIR